MFLIILLRLIIVNSFLQKNNAGKSASTPLWTLCRAEYSLSCKMIKGAAGKWNFSTIYSLKLNNSYLYIVEICHFPTAPFTAANTA